MFDQILGITILAFAGYGVGVLAGELHNFADDVRARRKARR